MRFVILVLSLLALSEEGKTQPVNDDCENAIDITPFAFNAIDAYDYFITTQFSGATVDGSNYGSNYCFGYTENTTPSFPDVWLKTTLQASANLVQFYSFYGVDTLQISTYIGTCSSLFQNDCYTFFPEDTLFQYGATLHYIPHDTAHALYFQIKAPETSTNSIEIHIHTGIAYTSTFYFTYSNPAVTNNTTSTNKVNRSTPDIRLFPMPVKDAFTIESTDEITLLEVYNMTGKRMVYEKLNSHSATIGLSQLSSGMYFLKIETKNGWAIRNFVVAQ
jgi:hypothetical protein